MDPYTLAWLAGHASFATTRPYAHPEAKTVLAAMQRACVARVVLKMGLLAKMELPKPLRSKPQSIDFI